MSPFLGFESYRIPLGSSIAQMRDTLKTAITAYGWRAVRGSHTGALIAQVLGNITTPANLFDVEFAPSTNASGTVPIWFGFKAVAAIAVTKFTMATMGPTAAPKTFNLEWSDDGSTWTVQQTWSTIVAWQSYECRYFTVAGTPGSHLYWRINVSAVQSGATLTLVDAKFWASDGSFVAPYEYVDFMPPATEVVGDANSEEYVRMKFTGTTLGLLAMQNLKRGSVQSYGIYEKTSGAVAGAVTINGVTVTQSVTNAAWTAKQNLRQLYYDLQASTDLNCTAWAYEYQQAPPQNANDTADWILMTRKEVGDIVPVATNAYLNGVQLGLPIPLNTTFEQLPPASMDITVDLVSGWVYYLQVNSRTFSIGSKTITNWFGPIFAWWRPNADAAATGFVNPFATLAELAIGFHDVETPSAPACVSTYIRPAHVYGISAQSTSCPPGNAYNGTFMSAAIRGKVQDYTPIPTTGSIYTYTANASGAFAGNSGYGVANDFQVHQVVHYNHTGMPLNFYTIGLAAWWPAAVLDGVYKFIGTGTNESSQLIQDSMTSTSLTAAFDETAVMTGSGVVNVGSTAAFPAAGYFVIGDEAFQFTGKTASSFTGVTRAVCGSIAYRHYASDMVYAAQWFVKFNGGALLAGYAKPA